jgi:hypothetical protein
MLIVEVEDASSIAKECAERARERALDPRLRPDEIEEQRRAMEDASFAQLYPAFADKLADLLTRIDANDREVAYVNDRLPLGCSPLLVAELIARGLQGFAQDGLDTPRMHLKTHHGFERMRLRGFSGARDEFHLAAIVQNLKTLANHIWRPLLNTPTACIA